MTCVRHRIGGAALAAFGVAMGLLLLGMIGGASAHAAANDSPPVVVQHVFEDCEASNQNNGNGNGNANGQQNRDDKNCASASTNTGAAGANANGAAKVTICHATGSASNPYVTITISENGLNGHGGHDGDIIPAPSGGCPSVAVQQNSSATVDKDKDKITICHATGSASNPYVAITIDKNGLHGHGDHPGDFILAQNGSCPAAPATAGVTLDHEKVTLCHATGSSSNPYVIITIDKNGLNGHSGHAGDIIPAPAGGCPTVAALTIIPGTLDARLQAAGLVIVRTGTVAPGSGESVTINGVPFVIYPFVDNATTAQLLRDLAPGTLVWLSGNTVMTAAPGTVIPAALEQSLLPQVGPSVVNTQAAADVTAGPAPLPAATGSGGMLGARHSSLAVDSLAFAALVAAIVVARWGLRVR